MEATCAALKPVEVDGFYRHMSDLGLRYGEEFRPIRELSAGGGQIGRPGRSVGNRFCRARANMRYIPFSSMARFTSFPPARRRSKVARPA